MEHVVCNKFMSANTPYWEKISQVAAKKKCMRTYEIEKTKLKAFLEVFSKVHVTTDIWTSCQKTFIYGSDMSFYRYQLASSKVCVELL